MSISTDRRPERVAIATQSDQNRRQGFRDKTERRLGLAEHLPDADRIMLEQVLGQGISMAELARLTGRKPDEIRRRVARLIKHVEQPIYRFLILHAELLDGPTRRTAERVIFGVRSLRAAADELGISLHQVRQHMRTVMALARL